jgi:hypothetical protein
MVRSAPFHGVRPGSNPGRVNNKPGGTFDGNDNGDRDEHRRAVWKLSLLCPRPSA